MKGNEGRTTCTSCDGKGWIDCVCWKDSNRSAATPMHASDPCPVCEGEGTPDQPISTTEEKE